jgi:hypothetical protein
MVQKIIFDVQDFKIANNEFVSKDVVILFNSSEYNRFLIKLPFSYNLLLQRQAKWVESNHHGLSWCEGINTYI